MRQHTCLQCGQLFHDSRPHAKYCCPDCYTFARGGTPGITHTKHTCPLCGKIFTDKRPDAKYCSTTCYWVAKRTLPEIPCERCGALFRPKDKMRFCSDECYRLTQVEQSEQRRSKICAHCGDSYTLPYGYAETVYCSRQCAGRAQRKPAGKKVNRSGHNFTDRQKRQILKRDNHQCVLCGSDMGLQVDHILAVCLGGSRDIANGQTLCHDCHAIKTAQDIAEMRDKYRP